MVKLLITFKRKQGMSHADFQRYRRDVHAPLLLAIPEVALIRRFVVSYPMVRAETPEPAYDAIVEAWFDSVADLDALYSSENFQTRVDPDHVHFIDLSSVRRLVSKEILVIDRQSTDASLQAASD